MAEKLSVRWDDFKDHTLDVIGSLKEETDFADVTLACEDGQQIHTHKLILVKSSPFFRDLLKTKNHPHPLVFMRGVKSEEMLAIMDFVYFGETNVTQESLGSFLSLAAELRLKGLEDYAHNVKESKSELVNQDTELKPQLSVNTLKTLKKESGELDEVIFDDTKDWRELDQKIQSLMEKSGNKIPGKAYFAQKCKVCGKEGKRGYIKDHIEANHLKGVTIPCNVCGKTFEKRYTLKQHTGRFHPNVELQDSKGWIELDDKIQTLMEKSSTPITLSDRLAYKCKVCGKEGQSSAIKEHIEANHVKGISISCNFCERVLTTRHALKQHIALCHLQ